MGHINQILSPTAIALRALLLAAPLVSSLQVTPNSPCSKVCVDSTTLDLSDPNSSNTRNSDIVCADVDLGSPKGSKWKDCMTCLQTSTFSQGSENDQAWFLYNLRYSLSYCVFGFPNATNVPNTPCRTSFACENLQGALEHGVLDPTKATPYSYCSVKNHEGAEPAKNHFEYERCSQCVAAERKTLRLANYLTALEAGCQQQPKLGKAVALNDTIFLDGRITIVDPTTVLAPAAPSSGLPTNTIVGIVVAGLAAIIIASAVSFVCYRKRVNRRKRADLEAKYYASGGGGFRHKHNSSLSFQCQTHMASPRFWPGAEGAALSPVNEMGDAEQKIDASAENNNPSWDQPHHPHGASFPLTTRSKNNSASSLPLHQITTSVPPAAPPNNAFTSPSSATGGGGYSHSPSESGAGNMSAVSARSTTALLPSSYRPYVPAEHGVHGGSPQFSMPSTFSSPVSGTTASPLLKNQTWQHQQQQQNKDNANQTTTTPKPQHRVKNFSTPLVVGGGAGSSSTSEGNVNVPPPPPGPPPPKAPRLALPKMPNRKQHQTPPISGSPVESTEIKTAFQAPPGK